MHKTYGMETTALLYSLIQFCEGYDQTGLIVYIALNEVNKKYLTKP